MMNRFAYLFAFTALWFWSSSSLAINLIYEPFDYTAGADLLGQRNTSVGTTAGTAVQTDTSIGNLWLRGAPVATPADTEDIVNGSLAGPSALKASVGNALSITDTASNSGAADRLAFRTDATSASNITSGTIYYSFLLRVDNLNGANDTSGDYFISLNNTANANTTSNPTVHPGEMRARIDPGDGTKYNLGMFSQHASITQGNAAWAASTPLSLGQTYFIVGAYNVGSTNSSQLWVDPNPLTFGLASAPAPTAQDTVSGTNGTTVGSLLLHQRNAVPDLTMDELRVATTWAEETPLGALTLYWDINGSNTGATDDAGGVASGTWDSVTSNFNSDANGTGGALTWSQDSAVVFSAGTNATGASTITVSGTQSANQIT
jgi:hypothetical protein